MWVALKRESGIHIEPFKEELRGKLAQALPDVQFSFEPADIINEVMSFGSPTPVEVAVSGPDFAETRPYAAKVMAEMAKIPGLRDLQIVQSLDYPTVQVDVDRKKAGTVYVTPVDVARSLGRGHLLQPLHRAELLGRSEDRHRLPGAGGSAAPGRALAAAGSSRSARSATWRWFRSSATPPARSWSATWPRFPREPCPAKSTATTCERQVSMTANIAGTDLGCVSREVSAALKRAGEPPPGVKVEVRGQIPPMRDMLGGLALGLGLAVVVIFLLLVRQFPVVAAVAGRRLHGPRGHRRRGADALPDPHDVEHPVLHRRDHGRRRGDGQRDSAGHVCRKPAPARGDGRGEPRRRPSRARGAGCAPSS